MLDLEPIKERLEAIKRSLPWKGDYLNNIKNGALITRVKRIWIMGHNIPTDAEGEFIANAPQDVEQLISEIEKLRKAKRKIAKKCGKLIRKEYKQELLKQFHEKHANDLLAAIERHREIWTSKDPDLIAMANYDLWLHLDSEEVKASNDI